MTEWQRCEPLNRLTGSLRLTKTITYKYSPRLIRSVKSQSRCGGLRFALRVRQLVTSMSSPAEVMCIIPLDDSYQTLVTACPLHPIRQMIDGKVDCEAVVGEFIHHVCSTSWRFDQSRTRPNTINGIEYMGKLAHVWFLGERPSIKRVNRERNARGTAVKKWVLTNSHHFTIRNYSANLRAIQVFA